MSEPFYPLQILNEHKSPLDTILPKGDGGSTPFARFSATFLELSRQKPPCSSQNVTSCRQYRLYLIFQLALMPHMLRTMAYRTSISVVRKMPLSVPCKIISSLPESLASPLIVVLIFML